MPTAMHPFERALYYFPDRRWCPRCKDAVLIIRDPVLKDPELSPRICSVCDGFTLPLPTPKADNVGEDEMD